MEDVPEVLRNTSDRRERPQEISNKWAIQLRQESASDLEIDRGIERREFPILQTGCDVNYGKQSCDTNSRCLRGRRCGGVGLTGRVYAVGVLRSMKTVDDQRQCHQKPEPGHKNANPPAASIIPQPLQPNPKMRPHDTVLQHNVRDRDYGDHVRDRRGALPNLPPRGIRQAGIFGYRGFNRASLDQVDRVRQTVLEKSHPRQEHHKERPIVLRKHLEPKEVPQKLMVDHLPPKPQAE
mmetsp:Transcript_7773/g.20852  ORF Transcript_7773/g.20852 Transcript_7773/m.20852 type:complete len:237 (+) Transcript_7773:849-1559(+)